MRALNTFNMEKNSVKEFEDARWSGTDQTPVFRHAEALRMVSKGQKVLDIGCGDGLLLEAMVKKGVIVSGVDISEEGVKKCRAKGLEASVANASHEKLPFQDHSVDTVTLLDILEHVYSPEVLLKEAVRVSRKNVIISVPNFNSLPARIQVLLGRVPENNRPHKGHLYWFNYCVLLKLLKKSNLRVEEVSCNTFWENVPVIGFMMKGLCRLFPSLFALSFVVKASTIISDKNES